MRETTWVGPKGTTVVIRNGSNKPPRWALLLIDRVAARKREGRYTSNYRKVGIRWTQGNGGGRFYASGNRDWYPIISVKAAGYGTRFEKEILIHELAHWTGDNYGHSDRFYIAMLGIARAEGTVGMLRSYPKAKMARARKALKEAA